MAARHSSWELLVVIVSQCNTLQGRSQNAEKVTHINGSYWNKQRFSSFASLFKMGTSLKGKNLLQRERSGSKFSPLIAVPFGMGNHFYHIR